MAGSAVAPCPHLVAVGPWPSVGTPSRTNALTRSVFQLWLADDGWLHEDCHLGPPGFAPQRPFSFSVLVGHGQSRVFSVDLGSELAAWERSFQRATFKEVQRSRVSASHPPAGELGWGATSPSGAPPFQTKANLES